MWQTSKEKPTQKLRKIKDSSDLKKKKRKQTWISFESR